MKRIFYKIFLDFYYLVFTACVQVWMIGVVALIVEFDERGGWLLKQKAKKDRFSFQKEMYRPGYIGK